MLSDLLATHQRIVEAVPRAFTRHLYNEINWGHRLIGVVGPRGAGKTTLVLQHYQRRYANVEECLYLAADHPIVLGMGLYEAVAEYFKYYGDCVIIDEVQKYPDWSTVVKGLYDSYPDKKFIILGSSMLNILHEKGDLSRRLHLHTLEGLSFREYLNVLYDQTWTPCDFDSLVDSHTRLCREIASTHSNVLRDFSRYCTSGYYPFFMECTPAEYHQLLVNVMDKVVYQDMPSLRPLQNSSSLKLKKLLAYLSISTVPTFKVSSITNEIDVSRDTLYEFLDLLERAGLASVIGTARGNVRSLRKSKILLDNPNLYYAISTGLWESTVDRGNLRESFFASQLRRRYRLHTSEVADFTVTTSEYKTYEVEIGGPNKDMRQLANTPQGLVFKDGIEHGAGPQIPLYLAGFLY